MGGVSWYLKSRQQPERDSSSLPQVRSGQQKAARARRHLAAIAVLRSIRNRDQSCFFSRLAWTSEAFEAMPALTER